MTITRPSLLRTITTAAAVGVLTVGLAACSAGTTESAPGSTTVDVQLGWVLNPQFGAFELADQEGYWADEELTVNLAPGGSNAIKGEQALAGGTAQIATSDDLYSIVSAQQAGTDIVVLGAVIQTTLSGVVSLSDDPIESLEDFEGRTLGIDPAAADRYKKAMVKEGIDPDSWSAIATSDANALVQGQVSGIGAFQTSQPVELELQGYETDWLSAESLGFPDYNIYIITTREFLDSDRDTVVGFMRGLTKGAERAEADPTAVAEASVNVYGADLGQDPESAQLQAEDLAEAMNSEYTDQHGLLRVDPEKISGPITESLVDLYGMTDVPGVDDILDQSVLDEVYGDSTSLLDDAS
ncbi:MULTISPECIES: ABC transporter substrate-binding protein [unclassified Rathayibacter]|uniref:ABC transporter substrate-binding protein n=1 Tax=unclassified Rathayibacter TaxID=2609250 RepID=UPI000FB687E3|nr:MULTISPECIES: ABC transporter substrate-binding protein [unclassified Rathayibacter]ROP49091.1 ABC-type nitrate/sulfonate/bicarbonate transport system substrate-binding protein [Rathayibacter sp. PhB186]ROS50792.1 ABC-type nitrate/sulfonate/bicarbonate transport system substrate-binding protein [Rathayibacter sp. PhB185]